MQKRSTTSITALLLVLAFSMTGCSHQARLQKHLKAAQSYYLANEYTKAEIEYKNALQLAPGNALALGRLGTIYFAQGRIETAYSLLRHSLQLEPGNMEVLLKLGQLYSTAGRSKLAAETAEEILEKDPRNPGAPLLLASSVLTEDSARKIAERLRAPALDPGHNFAVQVALGILALRTGDFATARKNLIKAQQLAPKSPDVYAAFGSLYWRTGDLARADASFAKAARLSPPYSSMKLLYAEFKLENKKNEEAASIARAVIKTTPDFLSAAVFLANISLAAQNFGEARKLVDRVLTADPQNVEATLMDARLKLALGHAAEAVSVLEKVSTKYPNAADPAFQLALAYHELGDASKAMDAVNRALALQPDFPEAAVFQAGLYVKRKDFNSAIGALKEIVKIHPNLFTAQLLLAEAYRGIGDFEDAITVYRELETRYPKSAEVPMVMGVTFMRENKFPEARAKFEETLALQPNSPSALEHLVDLDIADKDFEGAEQRIQKYLQSEPESSLTHLIRGKLELARNALPEAEAEFRAAIKLQPDNGLPYRLLVDTFLRSRQNAAALQTLQSLLLHDPNDTTALMYSGMLLEEKKSYAEARLSYEKLLSIDPDFVPALNNLACLYSDHFGETERAFSLAQRARQLKPRNPNIADTLGWIAYKMHRFPWALSLLTESANARPNDREAAFHLGMVYYMMGDAASAAENFHRALLLTGAFPSEAVCRNRLAFLQLSGTGEADIKEAAEKRLSEDPTDPIALSRLADVERNNGNLNGAVAAYRTVLATYPQNLVAMKNLARTYAMMPDHLDMALEIAKNAYKIAPDDPDIAYILGRLAYRKGNWSWAASLLERAVNQHPENADLQFNYAQAVYAIGGVTRAREAMIRVIAEKPDDALVQKARLFLELTDFASSSDGITDKSERIREISRAHADYLPAMMANAVALEQHSDRASAIARLEDILRKYPDFSPAMRELTILYSIQGTSLERAYNFAMKIRDDYGSDPAFNRALGILFYRRGEFGLAGATLKTVIPKYPRDPVAHYFFGLAEFRIGSEGAAREALREALDLGLSGMQAQNAAKILKGLE